MTSYTSEIVVGSAFAAALGVTAYMLAPLRPSRLFCLVEGETSYFSVKIRLDATVDELKKEIKTQIRTLHDFDANLLQLFRVDIDVSAEDMSKLPGQIPALNSLKQMNPAWKLSDYYSAPLSERTIHVLVKPPSGGK
jgi:hypothetical protein